jgi:hypothetical protein
VREFQKLGLIAHTQNYTLHGPKDVRLLVKFGSDVHLIAFSHSLVTTHMQYRLLLVLLDLRLL